MQKKRIFTPLLIALALASFAASVFALEVDHPYKNIDWATIGFHKANLHTHTTESDGKFTPDAVIDLYREHGYTVLALTDHARVTWPWQKFDREAANLGMVDIQGNEISKTHHINSYFCGYKNAGSDSEEVVLTGILEQGGVAVINHPGRYTRKQMHKPEKHLAFSWNVLLLSELNEQAVRTAMESGTLFFAHRPNGINGEAVPEIQSITVDEKAETIRIEATGAETIEWIAEGNVIGKGPTCSLKDAGDARYVRAMLYGPAGTVLGTQPFVLLP
jgi:hypothetical protein